jgi:hypothetical protein
MHVFSSNVILYSIRKVLVVLVLVLVVAVVMTWLVTMGEGLQNQPWVLGTSI